MKNIELLKIERENLIEEIDRFNGEQEELFQEFIDDLNEYFDEDEEEEKQQEINDFIANIDFSRYNELVARLEEIDYELEVA